MRARGISELGLTTIERSALGDVVNREGQTSSRYLGQNLGPNFKQRQKTLNKQRHRKIIWRATSDSDDHYVYAIAL
jgi:hypothetical protein